MLFFGKLQQRSQWIKIIGSSSNNSRADYIYLQKESLQTCHLISHHLIAQGLISRTVSWLCDLPPLKSYVSWYETSFASMICGKSFTHGSHHLTAANEHACVNMIKEYSATPDNPKTPRHILNMEISGTCGLEHTIIQAHCSRSLEKNVHRKTCPCSNTHNAP